MTRNILLYEIVIKENFFLFRHFILTNWSNCSSCRQLFLRSPWFSKAYTQVWKKKKEEFITQRFIKTVWPTHE